MGLSTIQQILESKIGFDPSRVSYVALENIVRKRMLALDIVDVQEYGMRLTANLSELQLFVEQVVVPETWFFRHHKVFKKLAADFEQLTRRYHTQGRIIRCLSLACSTGEEPYSLAMSLIDQGLPMSAFSITAVDISKDALEIAQQACFGKASFRADMPEPDSKHFLRKDEKHQLRPHVYKNVIFKRLNVLNAQHLRSLGQFDIIFCRNMLIYFSENKQRDVLLQVKTNLTETGILVVSPTEAPLVTQHLQLFQPDATIPLFYRKNDKRENSQRTPFTTKLRTLSAIVPVQSQLPEAKQHSLYPSTFSSEDVTRAWRLTDDGLLEEAKLLCEKMLNKRFSVPDVLYLLGVIEMARDKHAHAENLFRQHLVYQPDHLNALRYRQQALHKLKREEEADWCKRRIYRLTSQAQVNN